MLSWVVIARSQFTRSLSGPAPRFQRVRRRVSPAPDLSGTRPKTVSSPLPGITNRPLLSRCAPTGMLLSSFFSCHYGPFLSQRRGIPPPSILFFNLLPRVRSVSARIAHFFAATPFLGILAFLMGGRGYEPIEPYSESTVGLPDRAGHAPSGHFKGGEKSRGVRNGAVVKRSRIVERNTGRAE
jgi:hypothetical protein